MGFGKSKWSTFIEGPVQQGNFLDNQVSTFCCGYFSKRDFSKSHFIGWNMKKKLQWIGNNIFTPKIHPKHNYFQRKYEIWWEQFLMLSWTRTKLRSCEAIRYWDVKMNWEVRPCWERSTDLFINLLDVWSLNGYCFWTSA